MLSNKAKGGREERRLLGGPPCLAQNAPGTVRLSRRFCCRAHAQRRRRARSALCNSPQGAAAETPRLPPSPPTPHYQPKSVRPLKSMCAPLLRRHARAHVGPRQRHVLRQPPPRPQQRAAKVVDARVAAVALRAPRAPLLLLRAVGGGALAAAAVVYLDLEAARRLAHCLCACGGAESRALSLGGAGGSRTLRNAALHALCCVYCAGLRAARVNLLRPCASLLVQMLFFFLMPPSYLTCRAYSLSGAV